MKTKLLILIAFTFTLFLTFQGCKKEKERYVVEAASSTGDKVTLAEAKKEFQSAVSKGLADQLAKSKIILNPNWRNVYRFEQSKGHNALYVTLFSNRTTGEVVQMIITKDDGKINSSVVQAIPNGKSVEDISKLDYSRLNGTFKFYTSAGKITGILAVRNGRRLSAGNHPDLFAKTESISGSDQDGDGVDNEFDKCPDTPSGVMVNAQGCPLEIDLETVVIVVPWEPSYPYLGDTGIWYPPIDPFPWPDPETPPGNGLPEEPEYSDENYTNGEAEINGEQDPDFPSNCGSWAYQPTSAGLVYQVCGVSGLRFDFVTEYQQGDKLRIDYVQLHYDRTLYFEFPRIREDGSVIPANVAASLSAAAKDQAEEILESQIESSPPPANSAAAQVLLNRFLKILQNQMAAFGGRATFKNNYGTSSVTPYSKTITGAGCQ